MRRLIAAALVTFIAIEFSQTSFAQESLTGHTWRSWQPMVKIVFIRAFAWGFFAGRLQGYRNGAADAYIAAETLICDKQLAWKKRTLEDIVQELRQPTVKETQQELDACINFRKHKSEVVEELETRSTKYKDLQSSWDYYVKEVDSFYEAFPLCRGRMLESTLSKLTPIWFGIAISSEDSYNKIGSACGEQK